MKNNLSRSGGGRSNVTAFVEEWEAVLRQRRERLREFCAKRPPRPKDKKKRPAGAARANYDSFFAVMWHPWVSGGLLKTK